MPNDSTGSEFRTSSTPTHVERGSTNNAGNPASGEVSDEAREPFAEIELSCRNPDCNYTLFRGPAAGFQPDQVCPKCGTKDRFHIPGITAQQWEWIETPTYKVPTVNEVLAPILDLAVMPTRFVPTTVPSLDVPVNDDRLLQSLQGFANGIIAQSKLPMDADPDVVKRRAIVKQNPELSARRLCGLFDDERIPLPKSMQGATSWVSAYTKSKKFRHAIDAMIYRDRKK
jgi:hypothetical protein